ncbi:hypothetical protein GGI35DRAFT_238002 [Trichoderma velutinum]
MMTRQCSSGNMRPGTAGVIESHPTKWASSSQQTSLPASPPQLAAAPLHTEGPLSRVPLVCSAQTLAPKKLFVSSWPHKAALRLPPGGSAQSPPICSRSQAPLHLHDGHPCNPLALAVITLPFSSYHIISCCPPRSYKTTPCCLVLALAAQTAHASRSSHEPPVAPLGPFSLWLVGPGARLNAPVGVTSGRCAVLSLFMGLPACKAPYGRIAFVSFAPRLAPAPFLQAISER